MDEALVRELEKNPEFRMIRERYTLLGRVCLYAGCIIFLLGGIILYLLHRNELLAYPFWIGIILGISGKILMKVSPTLAEWSL